MYVFSFIIGATNDDIEKRYIDIIEFVENFVNRTETNIKQHNKYFDAACFNEYFDRNQNQGKLNSLVRKFCANQKHAVLKPKWIE